MIGCGALGPHLGDHGAAGGRAVTIYARDLLPHTRSARATGSWTPDSRIALEDAPAPEFGELWEQMARISFKTYRQYLGLPGNPVEWTDRYVLSDKPSTHARAKQPQKRDTLGFGRIQRPHPRSHAARQELPRRSDAFSRQICAPLASMQFNIADYGHTLMSDFFAAGGKFVRAEFHEPDDLDATEGKGRHQLPRLCARATGGTRSIVPVRGQIAWLIPQPEVNYGLYYKSISILSRRDGIVVQDLSGGDMRGYNNSRELADRTEADKAVGMIAKFISVSASERMRTRLTIACLAAALCSATPGVGRKRRDDVQ